MKKLLILAALILVFKNISAQTMLTANVADFSPSTAKDTSFKSNLTFDGNYLIGSVLTCTACDSVWISYKWACENSTGTLKWVYAPMFSEGAWVDSLFMNGTESKAVVISMTPFPFMKLDFNQVGNTKPTRFEAWRSKTRQ